MIQTKGVKSVAPKLTALAKKTNLAFTTNSRPN